MRILHVETSAYYPSSPLFLEALQEISRAQVLDHALVDEAQFLKRGSLIVWRVAHRLLGTGLRGRGALNRALLQQARCFRPDLILICKGANISPVTLNLIRGESDAVLVNYATDDPFNPINSTRDLVESIPFYDLYACTKRRIMADIQKVCPCVVYIPFAYKPTVHFPEKPANIEEAERFESDLVFIGGGDQDRFPYMRALIQDIPDLRLHLYGGYWKRDRVLAQYYKGFAYGREFRLALSGTKIAFNLVRRANRDGHVMRTFEIPACGAFMLAERTEEHLELFAEDKEAVYFDSQDELVDKTRYYLAHETERRRIAEAGRRKVLDGPHTYQHRLLEIIKAAEAIRPLRLGLTRRLEPGHTPSIYI
jgi:spore maturation protein CgeB